MRTMYAVVSGEYSGYGIHGLFDTDDLARAALPLYRLRRPNSDEFRVETFDVVESLEEIRPVAVYVATVDEMGREASRTFYELPAEVGPIGGVVDNVNVVKEWDAEWYAAIDRPHPWKDTRLGKSGRGTSLRSAAEALKAARDALARFKAEEAGIA